MLNSLAACLLLRSIFSLIKEFASLALASFVTTNAAGTPKLNTAAFLKKFLLSALLFFIIVALRMENPSNYVKIR